MKEPTKVTAFIDYPVSIQWITKAGKVVKNQIVEHNGVAYMPVPRCDRCRHWQPNDSRILPEASGVCIIADDLNTRMRHSGELGYLHTTADFGCVQWEAK